MRWPKYSSFSFSISPSNEYSGLISFGMDWLDLLVVQRALKSLLQHHSSKASILQCSAFFMEASTPGLQSITNSLSLLKLMSIESVMPSNHLVLCCPLLLPLSIFPSIRVFSSQFVASGGQSIGVSASVSVLPKNLQD